MVACNEPLPIMREADATKPPSTTPPLPQAGERGRPSPVVVFFASRDTGDYTRTDSDRPTATLRRMILPPARHELLARPSLVGCWSGRGLLVWFFYPRAPATSRRISPRPCNLRTMSADPSLCPSLLLCLWNSISRLVFYWLLDERRAACRVVPFFFFLLSFSSIRPSRFFYVETSARGRPMAPSFLVSRPPLPYPRTTPTASPHFSSQAPESSR